MTSNHFQICDYERDFMNMWLCTSTGYPFNFFQNVFCSTLLFEHYANKFKSSLKGAWSKCQFPEMIITLITFQAVSSLIFAPFSDKNRSTPDFFHKSHFCCHFHDFDIEISLLFSAKLTTFHGYFVQPNVTNLCLLIRVIIQ